MCTPVVIRSHLHLDVVPLKDDKKNQKGLTGWFVSTKEIFPFILYLLGTNYTKKTVVCVLKEIRTNERKTLFCNYLAS